MFKNRIFAQIMELEKVVENCENISLEAADRGYWEDYAHYSHTADKCRKQLARLRKKWANQQEEFPLVYSC